MSFNVGQIVIIASRDSLETHLIDEGNDPAEFWDYRDQYIVTATGEGQIIAYESIEWFGEDEDGTEIELDEPRGDGFTYYTEDLGAGYEFWSYEMLQELVMVPQNTPDAICNKVKQLYQKFNRQGHAFKFANV